MTLIPETCADALATWDSGKPVFTVEMGGLGPGYEQAIQIMAFEMLRDVLAAKVVIPDPFPEKGTELHDEFQAFWNGLRDNAYKRVDGNNQLGGLSGAQVGAASGLVWQVYSKGYRAAVSDLEIKDRLIQVSKFMPKAPEAPCAPVIES